MGVVDDFLKKMKMVSDDEFDDDDFDDYNDFEDEEEDEIYTPSKKKEKKSKKRAAEPEPEEDLYEAPEETGTPYSTPAKPQKKNNVVGLRSSQRGSVPEVCMIMPKSFDDANTIADVLLSHRAVVLNLEGIDMAAAQRIIDFASGSCYTVGGNLQKISRKIFIVVPSDMNLSGDFEEMVGDMIDLNAVNMMR